MKVNVNAILQWITAFLVYDMVMGQNSRGSFYKYIQLIEIFILFIIIIPEIFNLFLQKKNIMLSCLMVIYMGVVYISSYINKDTHNITNSYYSSLVYIVIFAELFLATNYLFRNRESMIISIQALLIISLIYCVINDVSLLIHYSSSIGNKVFLLGNKFNVSYAHIQMYAFYYWYNNIRKKSNITFSLFLIIYSILIMNIIDCTTGIVGLIIFLSIIYIVPIKKIKVSTLWISSICYSTLFAFYYVVILNYQFIQNIIVGVLGKQLTLTGRTAIYENIPLVLRNHILFGYGYGSDYEVWKNFMGMPNSQNGVIECIVEQGIISTGLLIVLIALVMKKSNHFFEVNIGVRVLSSIVIMYTLLASIEITISLKYILFVFLLNAYTELFYIDKDDRFVENDAKNSKCD